MLFAMRGFLEFCGSKRGRRLVNVVSVLIALGVGALAARHFAKEGWPLANADLLVVAVSGIFFLLAFAFKAFGWQRLFAANERPDSMALAAAGGAASVTGAALPGRFDDVVRVAVVRRYPGCPSGVGTLCLSLFMLGLVDTVALMPIASTAAATSDSNFVRVAMGIIAFAGVGAAVVIAILPRMIASGRLIRFRVARWMHERTTPPGEAGRACVLVFASWTTRAVALLVLLGGMGIQLSPGMALVFLTASAASAALPIAPAGAATQAGAGAAILIANGVPAGQAVAFAVAAQAMIIFAGAAVVLSAAVWQGGKRLMPARVARVAV
jgi:uncharacterized membrane protein YbhN (UPF0104 family)